MLGKTATSVSIHVLGVLLITAIMLTAPSTCSAEEITIDVAPQILNLASSGKVVTVHTSLPYSSVDVTSVYINGVAIKWWKADNRGFFVAKFSMDEVKMLDGLIIGDYNTLQVVGLTTGGEAFWGEDEVMVISPDPQGGVGSD